MTIAAPDQAAIDTDRRRGGSLTQRMIGIAALWIAVLLLLGGFALDRVLSRSIVANFDAQLEYVLNAMIAASEIGPGGEVRFSRAPADQRFLEPYSGAYFQISGAGQQDFSSRSLWDRKLTIDRNHADAELHKRDSDEFDGEPLRILERDVELPGSMVRWRYQVAQSRDAIDAQIRELRYVLVRSFLVLGFGLLVLAALQAFYGLWPLRRVRREVAAIRSGSQVRISDHFPNEINPLVDEINELLAHSEAQAEEARRHAGNLAHALKTPLTVITNAATANAPDLTNTVCREASTMRRQVDHHLARARAIGRRASVQARVIVWESAEAVQRAVDTLYGEVTIDLAGDKSVEVRVERQDLDEMLGNLVENAAKYGGGRVFVTVEPAADGFAQILIEDDGPGIAQAQRDDIFARGARLDTTGKEGTGLGLAIVRDVAEIYGGTITLDESEDLGGLLARLRLRRADRQFVEQVLVGRPSAGQVSRHTPPREGSRMSFRLTLLAAAACGSIATAAFAQAAPRFGTWGYDATAMDRSVKPGDDFFDFVNGAWFKRTEIAADRTFVGIDSVLNDQIDRDVRAIVEEIANNPAASGTAGRQVGDFYASFMDEAAIEARGTAPLKPYLARVAAVTDRGGLIDLFSDQSFTSPVGIFIDADPDDPTRYAAYASQSGLGLPNRDYYLLTGAKYDAFRAAYRAYMIRMQTLAGITDAAARADRIIALEKAIATAHWTPERSRDTKATNNTMTRAQLAALAPQLNWERGLANMELGGQQKVIVRQPSAIAAAGRLLDSVPLSTWKDYLTFHFVRTHAQYLPRAFDEAHFNFYSKTLRDVPTQRARWKRGVDNVNNALGEAVGQIYVARHYPPASDAQMGELVTNVRGALADLINRNAWMDAATKKEALAKLASFDPRTGRPAKWIDYATLKVVRGDPLGNAVASEDFDWKLQLSRLPKPIDRALWFMTPQTNNAYYDPAMNQITFPAAILQPPYFDPNADPASNYGSIGATIGHEIGHGFDDQGRQYDAAGKLRDWWTRAAAKAYESRAAMLVKQYDTYEPVPGVRIKGALTLGENIGDLGGLEMAYAAYRRHVARHGEPRVIDGLTGDQRFFIAYGYSWETKTREGALRQQLLTGPHSPARYRVNGAVRNMDAWYKAFDVKPGDKMYLPPEQRVRIW